MTTFPTLNTAVTPKFDYEAVASLYKANLETFVAAQRILFDFQQTVARRQVEMVKESFAKAETMLNGWDAQKQPQAYVDEAKAAIEKAIADVKETVDLGFKAQNEVVDLFVKRATANFDGAKRLAA
jgi:phasin family protein